MMEEANYQAVHLATIKNPDLYQDDIGESVKIVLRACADGLRASRASLWLRPEGERDLDCLALYNDATGEFETGAQLSEEAFPRYFDALHSGRLIDAVDTFTDPRTNELADSYLSVLDVRSLCDATIRNMRDGSLRGVLCVEIVGEQRDWTTDEKLFVSSMSDLISQRLVSSEWEQSEKRYEALFDATTFGVMVFGGETFVDVNPAVCTIFGGEKADIVGKGPTDFSPEFQPDGSLSVVKAMTYIAQCQREGTVTFDWVHQRIDGTPFDAEVTLSRIQLSGVDTLFALINDVTAKKAAQRQALEATTELEYRAAHDALTGLLNREQLFAHVDALTSTEHRSDVEVALFLLDIDRFKEINDTLGHSIGDQMLVRVAQVLQRRVNTLGGSVFRLGGDEFVAVFDSHSTAKPFDDLFVEIKDCLAASIEIGGVSVELDASIGASTFPHNGRDGHELLRCADVAMYHAKNHDGVSPWYSRAIDFNDRSRLSTMAELRSAIREDELVLHFQPRIELSTGRISGCEALVRWQHPERGLLPPSEFLALAEVTDLIHPLTEWVVDNAFDQIERLTALGLHIPVAINLSARNLPDTQLFDLIESRIKENEMCPQSLEIEITESALINNPQRAIDNLNRLDRLGVSIAIDDFGTGYSSLRLLKELPLDTIKIDRSFVREMLMSETDHSIVSSTIGLARNFSVKAIAEGVEDQATLDALRDLDCDEAQGFFIARPMPANELEAWACEHSRANAIAV